MNLQFSLIAKNFLIVNPTIIYSICYPLFQNVLRREAIGNPSIHISQSYQMNFLISKFSNVCFDFLLDNGLYTSSRQSLIKFSTLS